jgi:hypothetical protein
MRFVSNAFLVPGVRVKIFSLRWAQSEAPSGAAADFFEIKSGRLAPECSFVEARAEGGDACDAQHQGEENCAPLCERQLPRSFGRSTASSKTPLCRSGSRTCCRNWTRGGTKRRFQATADRSLKVARTEDIKAIRGEAWNTAICFAPGSAPYPLALNRLQQGQAVHVASASGPSSASKLCPTRPAPQDLPHKTCPSSRLHMN